MEVVETRMAGAITRFSCVQEFQVPNEFQTVFLLSYVFLLLVLQEVRCEHCPGSLQLLLFLLKETQLPAQEFLERRL